MANESAGILLFRGDPGAAEVLLVHPGGPFWVNKDHGAWSIPKGEIADGMDPLHEAIREVEEETGIQPQGTFLALRPVRQRGGKTVHAWALRGDFDPAFLRSNSFSIEWPPRSGFMKAFPEVDRAAWFSLAEARDKIISAQVDFLDQLAGLLQSETP
jgi:predicted NUDIX family NTP pyrophosphohydrolase